MGDNMKIIKAHEVYLPNKILQDAYVLVDNQKIKSIMHNKNIDCQQINLPNLKLLPGLIDIHIHGFGGYDFMSSTDNFSQIKQHLIQTGVVYFCPTTMTESLETIKNTLGNKSAAITNNLGFFLEGPYISQIQKGAHNPKFIHAPSIDELNELISHKNINSIAIAPELPNALESINFLRENNINVRIGHSDADYNQTLNAINAGANICIHTFNAMKSFHHRKPNITEAVLIDDNIYCEIICDFVHCDPNAVKLLLKCKPLDKIILITDCTAAGGLDDGKYKLGQSDIFVKNGIALTKENILAGSTLNLLEAIKNMSSLTNLQIAVNMATLNPAKALAFDKQIGSIETNKFADFIAIDDNFNLKFVMYHGEIILNRLS